MNHATLIALLSAFLLMSISVHAGIVTTDELMAAASSPDTFAYCTVADTATTVIAVKSGIGVEANPLFGSSVNAHKFLQLFAIKGAAVLAIYWLVEKYQEKTTYGVTAANAITCGVAARNAWILLTH